MLISSCSSLCISVPLPRAVRLIDSQISTLRPCFESSLSPSPSNHRMEGKMSPTFLAVPLTPPPSFSILRFTLQASRTSFIVNSCVLSTPLSLPCPAQLSPPDLQKAKQNCPMSKKKKDKKLSFCSTRSFRTIPRDLVVEWGRGLRGGAGGRCAPIEPGVGIRDGWRGWFLRAGSRGEGMVDCNLYAKLSGFFVTNGISRSLLKSGKMCHLLLSQVICMIILNSHRTELAY
jgi:hypothetical protein